MIVTIVVVALIVIALVALTLAAASVRIINSEGEFQASAKLAEAADGSLATP
jgi:hypothetical protein